MLERLEVVEHPIEIGRWLPMLSVADGRSPPATVQDGTYGTRWRDSDRFRLLRQRRLCYLPTRAPPKESVSSAVPGTPGVFWVNSWLPAPLSPLVVP